MAAPRNPVDFSKIKTQSAFNRHNLVRLDNLMRPGNLTRPEWTSGNLPELVELIKKARKNGKPVIWSLGAHVIKSGLSLYLIDLIRRGYITHLAGNGAVSIHDFELAFLGGTSEHVPTAIEDGSFGMWEETGAWMNEAIQAGAAAGCGYGESLARYIDEHPGRFPHKDICVLYQAYQANIPATYHIAIGTDIIHQHPLVEFSALGRTTGADFKTFCESVAALEGGVYLNFGSSVIGPEVFLKSLSIARNLGYPVFNITTANFDLLSIDPPDVPVSTDTAQYYYRPRKNIVIRPASCGGRGFHFQGDHRDTIPALYNALIAGTN